MIASRCVTTPRRVSSAPVAVVTDSTSDTPVMVGTHADTVAPSKNNLSRICLCSIVFLPLLCCDVLVASICVTTTLQQNNSK